MNRGEMAQWIERFKEIRSIKNMDMRSKRLKNLWNDLQLAYEYKEAVKKEDSNALTMHHLVKRELSTIN